MDDDDDGGGGRRGDGVRCATAPRSFIPPRPSSPGPTALFSRRRDARRRRARGWDDPPRELPFPSRAIPERPASTMTRPRASRVDGVPTAVRPVRPVRSRPGAETFPAIAPDTFGARSPDRPALSPALSTRPLAGPIRAVNAPNAGRRAQPTPPATSTRPSGARPSSSSADPAPPQRPRRRRGAFGAAPQPRAPPSRSNSTGIGTSRHESAATFHNDLFAGEPAAAPPPPGGTRRGRRPRRPRRVNSPRRNAASDRCTAEPSCRTTRWASRRVGAAAAGPGRPVAPGGFADLDRPAPTARQVSVGARQAASSSSARPEHGRRLWR